jgi:hypothetical protein
MRTDRSTTPWARDEWFWCRSAGELPPGEIPAVRVANREELAQANDLATALVPGIIAE